MKNELLTICIPTYNRAKILDEAIRYLLPIVEKFKFEIIISDNNSNDDTKEVVCRYANCYPYIKYYKQSTNIGGDKNFITCYQLATSKYIWILGDSSRIYGQYLPIINRLLESNNYDAIIMNAHNRVKGVFSRKYTNPEELMYEIGWQVGLISSTIISKKMSTEEYIWRYRETNFIHFGLLIEYICKNENTSVYWLNEHVATHTKLNKIETSWLPKSFEVYGKNYMAFVFSLPSQISTDTKLKCIKDHSLNQGIFEFRNICAMRSRGWLRYNEIKKYRHFLPFLTNTPWCIVKIISLLPRFIFKAVHKVLKRIQNTSNNIYYI